MSIKRVVINLLRPLKTNIQNITYLKNGVTIAHNVSVKNSKLNKRVNLAMNSAVVNSDIGKYSSIGRYTKVENVKIGSYCSIAWDVTIGAPSHPFEQMSAHAFTYRHSYGFVKNTHLDRNVTNIGNDVWIGCNSVILEGVKVHDGAIIAAGAVVTKDVPPYSIVGGVPAKVIKYRFSEDVIEKLIDMAWWEYDEEFIRENIDAFNKKLNIIDIERLVEKYNEKNSNQNTE